MHAWVSALSAFEINKMVGCACAFLFIALCVVVFLIFITHVVFIVVHALRLGVCTFVIYCAGCVCFYCLLFLL